MDPLTEALTYGLALASIVVAVCTFAWSRRLAAAVGKPSHRQRPRRGLRMFLLVGVLATGALVWFQAGDLWRTAPLLILVGAALNLLTSPGFQDSVYGDRGVQYGWYARRFEQLEAWRLTGEHLRWRLFGEWVSSRVPPSEHTALRARLEELAPGRESRFSA